MGEVVKFKKFDEKDAAKYRAMNLLKDTMKDVRRGSVHGVIVVSVNKDTGSFTHTFEAGGCSSFSFMAGLEYMKDVIKELVYR